MVNNTDKEIESKQSTEEAGSDGNGSPATNDATNAAVTGFEVGSPAAGDAARTDEKALTSSEATAPSKQDEAAPSIEELVERKVAEKISAILPEGLEAPRIPAPREQLSASDYLRLGYGTRSPHI